MACARSETEVRVADAAAPICDAIFAGDGLVKILKRRPLVRMLDTRQNGAAGVHLVSRLL